VNASILHLLRLLIAASMLLGSASLAPAQEILLLTTDGAPKRARLLAIDARSVLIQPDGGPQTTVPIDQCVGWVRMGDAPALSPSPVRIELDDGQVLRSAPDALGGDENGLVLTHVELGAIRLNVEQMRSIVLTQNASPPQRSAGDVLTLVNGDRLEGLVTRAGKEWTLEPLDPAAGAAISVPMDRLAAATFVTSARTSTLPRIWLADGSVIDAKRATLDDDGLFRLHGVAVVQSEQLHTLGEHGVNGMLLMPGAIAPLAALQPGQIEAPAYRLQAPGPRIGADAALGLAEVEISGPCRVEYALPEGWDGATLLAEAYLPQNAREYGDYEVIIHVDGKAALTQHIDREKPLSSLHVPIRGKRFSVEVTEGRGGPVQDRLILRQALLLRASARP
jgi:hypothetical protein